MNINKARFLALREIDRSAGEARLRYITDVPGQQAVYITKLHEAQSYASAYAINSNAAPPPYIAAEATVLGQSAITVANTIIGLAALWSGSIGPTIEAARLGGKAAVKTAQSPEALQIALTAALASLRVI